MSLEQPDFSRPMRVVYNERSGDSIKGTARVIADIFAEKWDLSPVMRTSFEEVRANPRLVEEVNIAASAGDGSITTLLKYLALYRQEGFLLPLDVGTFTHVAKSSGFPWSQRKAETYVHEVVSWCREGRVEQRTVPVGVVFSDTTDKAEEYSFDRLFAFALNKGMFSAALLVGEKQRGKLPKRQRNRLMMREYIHSLQTTEQFPVVIGAREYRAKDAHIIKFPFKNSPIRKLPYGETDVLCLIGHGHSHWSSLAAIAMDRLLSLFRLPPTGRGIIMLPIPPDARVVFPQSAHPVLNDYEIPAPRGTIFIRTRGSDDAPSYHILQKK